MKRIFNLAIAVIVCLQLETAVGAAEKPQPNAPVILPGRIIVRIEPERANAVSANLVDQGYRFSRRFEFVDAEVWTFPKDWSVDEAIADLRKIAGIKGVWPGFLYELHDFPNDGEYGKQYALPLMEVPEAWTLAEGSEEVIIAVIDTGIDLNHPDLQGRIYTNIAEENGLPGVDDDGNGYIDDVHGWDFVGPDVNAQSLAPDNDPSDGFGHGTMTSGVIAAAINNSRGIAGVIPNVRIMPLKVAGDSGAGGLDTGAIIEAIEYARANGAHIANASFGKFWHDHVQRESIQKLQDGEHEILFVASAGNDGADNDDMRYAPCSYTLANIVSVMATDALDLPCSFTSYGSTAVDMAAPGGAIRTTVDGGVYGNASGTSFSAPYVAGIAGMLMQVHPGMTAREVKLMLMEGTDPVISLAGRCVTRGRGNAYRALTMPAPKTLTESAAYDPAVNIPDDGTPVTRNLSFSQSVFIRAVSISVAIEHDFMDDLEIAITSPADTTVVILEPSADHVSQGACWPVDIPYTFDTGWAFRGEASEGIWSLTVKDTHSGSTGTLQGWCLEIHTYDDDDSIKIGGGVLCTDSSAVTIKNCILWGNESPQGNGPQLAIGSGSSPSNAVVYHNDIEEGLSDIYVDNDCTLDWGDNNIDADPLFSTTAGDYHLQSTCGRWDPTQEDWAIDQSDSPCLDKGDAAPTNEPEPCGFKINLGAYGDTEEASKSKWPLIADADGDCQVTVKDLLFIRNRLSQDPSSGDNWKANVNEDATINILDLLFARNNLGNTCE